MQNDFDIAVYGLNRKNGANTIGVGTYECFPAEDTFIANLERKLNKTIQKLEEKNKCLQEFQHSKMLKQKDEQKREVAHEKKN